MLAALLFFIGVATVDARDMCHYLRCGACEVLSGLVWDRLTDLDSRAKSFQVSHRLGKTGKGVAHQEYRTSELRTLEAVENICDKLTGYNLNQDPPTTERPWRRFFSKLTYPKAVSYGRSDKLFASHTDKHLSWWCSHVVSEYDDEISAVIRDTATAEGVAGAIHSNLIQFKDALCNATIKVCSGPEYDSAARKLESRFNDHTKRVQKKKDEAKAKAKAKLDAAFENVDADSAAAAAADAPPAEGSDAPASDDAAGADSTVPVDAATKADDVETAKTDRYDMEEL